MKFLKNIGRKCLKFAYDRFYGTGIGRIPYLQNIFFKLADKVYTESIEINGLIFKHNLAYGIEDSYYLATKGYESHVKNVFLSLIEEGMLVVDIGASIGYYTLIAAKKVGKTGLVLAFEPEPVSFKMLIENIESNQLKNVKAYQIAISDENGENTLHVPVFGIAGSTFAPLRHQTKLLKVKTIMLDDFVQDCIDIIKIDIEGAEVKAFHGMKRILKEDRPKIICEVHPRQMKMLGYTTKELEEFLRNLDYNFYLIENNERLKQLYELQPNRAHYLFSPEEVSI